MNIQQIRTHIKQMGLEAYVVAHGNRFIGEDIKADEHKLKQICGFSGSAGILAITADKCYLLVDGRYELQARLETNGKRVEVVDMMPRLKNVCDLLSLHQIHSVGYDSWNHSVAEMEFIKRRYKDMLFTDIGDLVTETPNVSPIIVRQRDVKFAGLSREQKCHYITDMLAEKSADYCLITAADSVSWLLNIYAEDLPYSPIVRAYALISSTGDITLFGNNLKADLPTENWDKFAPKMAALDSAKIMYDPHNTPEKIKSLVSADSMLIKMSDICQTLKAEKNPTELNGMINCHIRDGVALSKFLCWLEQHYQGLSELDVVEKLHEFRSRQDNFFSESFATISGSAENGAIVHYQPNRKSNRLLADNNLLLIDSGGQYLDGTTDVTRTIALGTPSAEMIKDFTLVLKAHISLAQARFPVDTAGTKLDIVARGCLWQEGLDYKHGTGHGVACFGNVHEGPISISPNSSEYGFKANMVTSDEPGIYKEGKYGIRIENLQYTAKVADFAGEFLEFRYLTKVPIDKRLIAEYMLTDGEKAWLNNYHRDVFNDLAPYMNETEKLWLKDACSPL